MTTLAVDVGGSSFKLAEYDGHRPVRRRTLPHDSHDGDLELVEQVLTAWCADPTPAGPPQALGIALPGVVDPVTHRMTSVHDKVGQLIGMDLVTWAERSFGLAAVIDNDARAAGWGEYVAGAGRGADVMVCFTLGTGVGTSVVIDGHLLRGRHGQAGILGGHQRIDPGGPRCTCGGVGCLEALASLWALRAGRTTGSGPNDRVEPTTDEAELTFSTVLTRAAQGEAEASRVRTSFLRSWAIGIGNACQWLEPDVVVLTGGAALRADLFLADLTTQVTELAWDSAVVPDLRVANDVWASATLGIADLAARATGHRTDPQEDVVAG